MEYVRPRGGLFAEQRRQNGESVGQRIRKFFHTHRAGGLVIKSAEGTRFYGSEKPLPTPPIDERAAEIAKQATASLARVELPDELAGTMSCFEETQPDGTVSGRIWVRREPIISASKE